MRLHSIATKTQYWSGLRRIFILEPSTVDPCQMSCLARASIETNAHARTILHLGIPKDRQLELADGHGLPNPEEAALLEGFAHKTAALRPSGRRPHKVPAKASGASLIRFPEGGLGRAKGPLALDRTWIQSSFQAKPENLAIFTIEGDAMAPTLHPGDLVLAQEIQSPQDVSDGLHLLRNPTTGRMLPRRLQVDLEGRIHLTTDSVHLPPTVLTEAILSQSDMLYRILWHGREGLGGQGSNACEALVLGRIKLEYATGKRYVRVPWAQTDSDSRF